MNEEQTNKKNQRVSKELKELVIARLEASSRDRLTYFGAEAQELTKEQLIEHVRKEDATGKKIIEIELNYLKALAKGELLKVVMEA